MKYIKFFAFLLGVLALSSCSDDKPSYNTNKDVVVSMADANITFRENMGVVNIPVKVEGTSNGIITVVCSVEEAPGSEPAMEDVHFLLTSNVINIEAGASEAYFEIRLKDDRLENNPRNFIITLESVDGASLGGILQTYVEITDNDQDPYERMGGEWYLMINGGIKGTVWFHASEPGELGFGESYTVTGLLASNPVTADFEWNEETKVADVKFKMGEMIADYDGTEVNGYLGYYNQETGAYGLSGGAFLFEWNSGETPNIISFVSGPDNSKQAADFALFYTDPASGRLGILDTRFNVTGFEQDDDM